MSEKITSLVVRSQMDLTEKVQELKEKKYNILLPVTEFASRSELFVPRLDIVIPKGVIGGDYYHQGNKQIKDANGKDVWVKPLAPTAQFLNKVAGAANMQWHPDKSGHTVVERNRVIYKAVAAVRQADGQWRIITDEYELDLEVIEEELRMDYRKKAKAETFQKRMKSDDMDLEDYILRDLLQKRKHKLALASTGAMNRVIRKALTLQNTYLPDEAQMPFAIARFDFQPDYSDPTVRRYASIAAVQSQNALFGGGGVAMPENVTPAEAQAADQFINQGHHEPDDFNPEVYEGTTYDHESGPKDTVMDGPQMGCADCGLVIDASVDDFSKRRFGRPLCRECQKAAGGATR